jgi:hypothetical protein
MFRRSNEETHVMNKNEHQPSRRDFLKKVGYTAPVILTLTAAPAFAGIGSRCNVKLKGNNGIGQEKHGRVDGPPPGLFKKPNKDFNDNGIFTGGDKAKNGAKYGGRPW